MSVILFGVMKIEYERTQNEEFKKNIDEIVKYLDEYNEIIDKLESSIEIRIFKYLIKGYSPTKTVNKIAEENYLNGLKPISLTSIWGKYKKVKKFIKL